MHNKVLYTQRTISITHFKIFFLVYFKIYKKKVNGLNL